jgi:hypothetical protein
MKALFTKLLPAAALALGSSLAFAVPVPAVSNIDAADAGGVNDGSFFLAVYDSVAGVSVYQKLGLTISGFETGAAGSFEFGTVQGWSTFSSSTLSNVKWAVFAIDNLGPGTTAGQRRVLATVENPMSGGLYTNNGVVTLGDNYNTWMDTPSVVGANPSIATTPTDPNYLGRTQFTSVFNLLSPLGFWEGLGEAQNFFKATNTGTGGSQANKSDYAGVFSLSEAGLLTYAQTSEVPLPAAAWLLLSGLSGLGVIGRRRKVAGSEPVAA